MKTLFDLTHKTALVTGCSRGIGLAMAVGLAEAGADIVGVSATLDPAGSEVGDAVREVGRTFDGYRCDFSDRAALYAFIGEVKLAHPTIDILVNNAGTIARSPAVDHDDESWDRVLGVNLMAPIILSREFGREMVSRGSGKIIFTASVLTFQGGLNVPSYAASKGGIGQLTKALANEWAAAGVQVNAIAPGYIRTDINRPLQEDPVRYPAISERIPAGRWGEPEDLKGAVVFLASAASDYVSGEILKVDGGWMSR